MKGNSRGQVVPLFALMLVAIFAIAALAIDVSNVYQERRAYRTAADAAALAGAQDLQATGTRTVGAAQYSAARANARLAIERHFNASATCTLTGSRSDCTLSGLPYRFSIITPLPSAASCATCDPARSVQVNFTHPSYSLTFARILGYNEYSVAVTAVAGLRYNQAYAIFTLRPPSAPAIPGVRSLAINGGTAVIVKNGDVGSNANMVYSGYASGSKLWLDPGYKMDYYDPFNAPLWNGSPPDPVGTRIFALVPDPGYPVPLKGSLPPTGAVNPTGCAAIAAAVYANPNYAPSVPVVAGPPIQPDMDKITCYRRGVYSSEVSVSNGRLAILEPGLYFFDGGLEAQGSVIGGYTPNSEGVALVFPRSAGTMFKNRTSGGGSALTQIVALNAGTRYLNPGGSEATAARDYSGGLVQTNTTPPKLMTLIVPPDSRCPVVYPFSATCTNLAENQNKAIDLTGGSGVYLAGVQYAPSDNVTVAGNAT
ncbi:MAG: pilus assembly protein TadG-related protein, partial [Anaerolineae bacterium]